MILARRYRSRRHYSRQRNLPRRSPPQQAAIDHVAAYHQLEGRLGPVVSEIKSIFLRLDHEELEHLLYQYEQTFGRKAADYARVTLPKWRNGSTKMSGQTAQRIINLVPPYLTTGKRFELVRLLCNYHRDNQSRHITVDPKEPSKCIPEIRASLDHFKNLASSENLSDDVFECINWINDYDSIIARKMLSEIQQQQAHEVQQAVNIKMPKILDLVEQNKVSGYHEQFNFPNGKLFIFFEKSQPCFIATAIYGNPEHPDVRALRSFRDTRLNRAFLGQKLITYYWVVGPMAARWVVRFPSLRAFTRELLHILVPFLLRQYYERKR